MIALAPEKPTILVKSYTLDLQKGQVTFNMPNLDPAIANSVRVNVDNLQQDQRYPANFTYNYNDGNVVVTIAAQDITVLALKASNFMLRRGEDLSTSTKFHYASAADIQSILGDMKKEVEKNQRMPQQLFSG